MQRNVKTSRPVLATAVAVAFCAAPAVSQAYMTTDDLIWPDSGAYPAYPAPAPDGHVVHAWVSGGYYHDDNLFRLSGSVNPVPLLGRSDKSDNITRLGLGLKADVPVSRQHLVLEAQMDSYHYDHFSLLNNTAYSASGTWQWQYGNDWNGTAGIGSRRFLGGFGELQAPAKDMVTETHTYGSAAYALTARYKLRGALDYYNYSHDLPGANILDNDVTSGTVGVDYVTPELNSLGLQIKYSDGNYQNSQLVGATLVDNRYNETETSAVAHWVVSGKSTIDARLGYTSRKHKAIAARDFGGATGSLNYTLQVGSKTALIASAYRELKAYEALPGSFAPTYGDFTAAYVLSNGLSFGPRWAPTATIVLQAQFLYEKRDFKGDPSTTLLGTPEREDTYRGTQLSVGYRPIPRAQLSLSWEHGNRSSNLFGRDFIFNAWYANAKYTFY